jgi:Putative prokaryotic signal transducing protein
MRAADPADGQAWVAVATLEDPLEAQLLEEVFREAEIPVAMPGTQHRAMLGVLGGYVHIPVQVPQLHALEARQLVDAYRLNRAQVPAEPLPGATGSTDEEEGSR